MLAIGHQSVSCEASQATEIPAVSLNGAQPGYSLPKHGIGHVSLALPPYSTI